MVARPAIIKNRSHRRSLGSIASAMNSAKLRVERRTHCVQPLEIWKGNGCGRVDVLTREVCTNGSEKKDALSLHTRLVARTDVETGRPAGVQRCL